jgi:hypothetical protein
VPIVYRAASRVPNVGRPDAFSPAIADVWASGRLQGAKAMRLLLIVIVIIVIAAMFQASRKSCYWHGDPVAWTSCLLR